MLADLQCSFQFGTWFVWLQQIKNIIGVKTFDNEKTAPFGFEQHFVQYSVPERYSKSASFEALVPGQIASVLGNGILIDNSFFILFRGHGQQGHINTSKEMGKKSIWFVYCCMNSSEDRKRYIPPLKIDFTYPFGFLGCTRIPRIFDQVSFWA